MSGWTDGWEDDDVILEDDDEIFVPDGDSVGNQPELASESGMQMGAGLFVGRLTQMISQVAAPPIEEQIETDRSKENGPQTLASRLSSYLNLTKEENVRGWDDDLESLEHEGGWDDLDGIDVHDIGNETSGLGNHMSKSHILEEKATDVSSPVNRNADSPLPAEDSATFEIENEVSNGWDDSICLEDDEGERKNEIKIDEAISTPRSGPSPLPFHSVPIPIEAMSSLAFSAQADCAENDGWDDPDLDDLDQLEDTSLQKGNNTEQASNASSERTTTNVDSNSRWIQDLQAQAEEINVERENVWETRGGSESVVTIPQPEVSPLVDQVPGEQLPSVAQRDSIFATASDQSGTLGEESYPDEQYFGPVVDHLPPPFRPVTLGTESLATQVRLEELDQDENEVGEDTEPGEASEEALNNGIPGPVVVDHVPPTPLSRQRVRDSTVAVVSQQSSTIMEDIWREDFAPNDEDYGPVVDQLPRIETPAPFSRSWRSNASLALQRAITEEDNADDEEVTELISRIGMFSGASIADSMAVVAPVAENDEENTVGQTIDGADGDTLRDDETVSNAPLTTDGNNSIVAAIREEPLVDHVPLQRGSNPIDASTLVLADPSEVSTVGDMTYEDTQYGPVVDVTPPPRPNSWVAAGAGSIMVAATKSECPDDLEDEMDGETYAMGTGYDAASLDTSLGEQNHPDDQLVDHVPEGSGLRRVNSASAIAEAHSVISTREDEFGLVVDHTPVVALGTAPLPRESVGALATLSECETFRSDELCSVPGSVVRRRVVVDEIPLASTINRSDSTLANKSIDESVDEDTIDEIYAVNDFGPVVDHLPFVATPIPVSRGGSTAGALATLSEADFDEDGWEDDDDLELQDGATVCTATPYLEDDEYKEETPETRNKSVTFQNIEGAPNMPYLRDSSAPENSSFRPYFDQNLSDESKENANNTFVHSNEVNGDCATCLDRGFINCPCIREILAYEGDKVAVIGRRTTSDGIELSIDYNKLLQHEVTKRMLLEKELEKCQMLIESFQSGDSLLPRVATSAIEDSTEVLKANVKNVEGETEISQQLIEDLNSQLVTSKNHLKKVSTQLKSSQDTNRRLKDNFEEIVAKEKSTSEELGKLKVQSSATINDLKNENQSLRQRATESEAKAKSELHLRTEIENSKAELENRISNISKETELTASKKYEALAFELNSALERVSTLELQLTEKSQKVFSLEGELKSALLAASCNSRLKEELTVKEANFKAEIQKLHLLLKSADSAKDLEEHYRSKINSLEETLKEKESTVSEMEQHYASCIAKLHESEAVLLSQVKESTLSFKNQECTLQTLKQEFSAERKKLEADLATQRRVTEDVTERLNSALEELRVVSHVKEELKNRVQHLLMIAEEKENLQKVVYQSQDENRTLKSLLEEERLRSVSIQSELSEFQEIRAKEKAIITELREKLRHYEITQSQVENVLSENQTLKNSIEMYIQRMNYLEVEVGNAKTRNEVLLDKSKDEMSRCLGLQKELEASIKKYNDMLLQAELREAKQNHYLSENKERIKKLEDQLSIANQELFDAHSHSKDLALHADMVNDLRDKLRNLENVKWKKENTIKDMEKQLLSASQQLESIAVERDGLRVRVLHAESVRDQLLLSEEASKNKVCDMELESHEAKQQISKLQAQSMLLTSKLHDIDELNDYIQNREVVFRQKEAELMDLRTANESLLFKLHNISEERDTLIALKANMERTLEICRQKEKESEELKFRFNEIQKQLSEALEHHASDIDQLRQRDEIEGRLREDITSLFKEREIILSDLRHQEEDCEEMLVQLGLNKEQMDAKEKEISALHDALRSCETNNVRITNSLHAAEEHVRRLEQHVLDIQSEKQYTGNQENVEEDKMKHEVDRLLIMNADLQLEVDDLRSAIAFANEEVRRLAAENEVLQDDEQSKSKPSQISEEAYESLRSKYATLDAMSKDLADSNNSHMMALEQLNLILSEKEDVLLEHEKVAQFKDEQIKELLRELQGIEQKYHTKEADLMAAQQQLQDFLILEGTSENAAVIELSNTIDGLRLQLRRSEQQASIGDQKLRELTKILEANEKDMEETKRLLSLTQDSLWKLEKENSVLDSMHESSVEAQMKLGDLSMKLRERDESIHVLELEKVELGEKIRILEAQLQTEIGNCNKFIEDVKQQLSEKDNEIQTVRLSLEQSQQQKDELMKNNAKADERFRAELGSLHTEHVKTENRVNSLSKHIESLNLELTTTKTIMASKEEELHRVSLELESNLAAQMEATQRVTTKMLESGMLQTEAENSDNLRSLVITLSQALEKSESQRADAIDRLLRERKTNADSLKRLGESVKRFYTTLHGN
jgi:chromosome segregation ATPase